MGKSTKFYAVRVGHKPGVYETWADCEAQVKGVKGAKYKSFPSRELAEKAVQDGWVKEETIFSVSDTDEKTIEKNTIINHYIESSISVDAACSGNPGKMEYQCVDTSTGDLVFTSPVYPVGTNNIGEFLGVVHALRYLHGQGDSTTPIYTDSRTALAWVRNKHVKTDLPRNAQTALLFMVIEDAIQWLQTHSYTNPVIKWETKHWGDSKADFGRK